MLMDACSEKMGGGSIYPSSPAAVSHHAFSVSGAIAGKAYKIRIRTDYYPIRIEGKIRHFFRRQQICRYYTTLHVRR